MVRAFREYWWNICSQYSSNIVFSVPYPIGDNGTLLKLDSTRQNLTANDLAGPITKEKVRNLVYTHHL